MRGIANEVFNAQTTQENPQYAVRTTFLATKWHNDVVPYKCSNKKWKLCYKIQVQVFWRLFK